MQLFHDNICNKINYFLLITLILVSEWSISYLKQDTFFSSYQKGKILMLIMSLRLEKSHPRGETHVRTKT